MFALAMALGMLTVSAELRAQEAKPSGDAGAKSAPAQVAKSGHEYSGMYTFLKEGEFVQVTVKVLRFLAFGGGVEDDANSHSPIVRGERRP